MKHLQVLETAAKTISQRDTDHGTRYSFPLAAQIASLMTGKEYTPAEITLILHAVKLARRRTNPANTDNYVDGAAYLAFAAEYETATPPVAIINPRVSSPPVDLDRGLRELVERNKGDSSSK
jgi:hypothetical protein